MIEPRRETGGKGSPGGEIPKPEIAQRTRLQGMSSRVPSHSRYGRAIEDQQITIEWSTTWRSGRWDSIQGGIAPSTRWT